ncbi:hepatitis A virus cellular receptor 1 homolog isoform X2 [Xenopus laevis]|uniref:Hepatitis A virus cellular receptor 1 homolog isoform X2 n=1 Tax=Xenopus laevis TaxID=8355 RepID=A0A8J0UT03_XENLA|nr:hepatitis A virus cellular receptor 1 homolog isoform X2 [Xenopus laevis]
MAPVSFGIFFFLLLLPNLGTAEKYVIASEGDTLVLPCTYSIQEGISEMCWGKSSCLGSCYKVIIWTDTKEKTLAASGRYELLGNLAEGDVSLTITGLTFSDSGTFCCRVETPGGVSYEKNRIHVTVREGRPMFFPTSGYIISEATTSLPAGGFGEDQTIKVVNIIRLSILLSFILISLGVVILSRYKTQKDKADTSVIDLPLDDLKNPQY